MKPALMTASRPAEDMLRDRCDTIRYERSLLDLIEGSGRKTPIQKNDPNYPFHVRTDSWRGPGVKFMHLSYDSQLATRDGTKCRQIINSPLYKRLWGHRVRLRPDQNQKTRFDNLAGGHRLSTSEGGVITGEGGDIIIFDDPHNVRAIGGASDVAREKTLR